tara:strand:- start:2117 stop:2386 length:270 start_codon:yes stop_codon:yes gene_type:complete
MVKIIYSDIREQYFKYEMYQGSAGADGDKIEANHWADYMEALLTKMTSEQRSLILDGGYYWDAPEARKKTLATVKEQEVGGIKYMEDEV